MTVSAPGTPDAPGVRHPSPVRALVASGPKLPTIVELVRMLRASGTAVDYAADLESVDPTGYVVFVAASSHVPPQVAHLTTSGFQVVVVLDGDAVVSPSLCIAAGASAVVLSSITPDELAALLTVTSGGMCVVPNAIENGALTQQRARAVASLSATERAWLREAAAGRTLSEIAADHGWSVRTLHRRMQRIYENLGVSGLSQALALVVAWDSAAS